MHSKMSRYLYICVFAASAYSLLWAVHIWRLPEKRHQKDMGREMDTVQRNTYDWRVEQNNGFNQTLPPPPTTTATAAAYAPPRGRPPAFLPNYRNPCWYVNSSDHRFNLSNAMCTTCQSFFRSAQEEVRTSSRLLRCLPYFFLIGPQKCGTTDLWDKLLYHPRVVGGLMKEPHYWAWRQPHGAPLDQYIDLYHRAATRIESVIEGEDYHPAVTGDASATTIWNNWEWDTMHPGDKSLPPHRIYNVIPHAKILLIVRDPIKRIVSDFLYFLPNKKTQKDREEFEGKVIEGIEWLDHCFAQHNRSHCIYSPVLGGSSFGWHWTPQVRLRLGLYAEFLEDWLAVFPRHQVHVEILDDYSVDKLPVLNRIFNFLGVGELPLDDVKLLKNATVKNVVSKHKYDGFGEVSERVIDRLHKFYDPFSHKLSVLMERHLPWNCVYAEC